jgi:FixJ family two-component response regulator
MMDGREVEQGSLRVAVVDDDTIVREGLAALLPHHRVIVACTTVEQLLAESPNVVIYTNEHRRIVLAGCLAAGAQGIVHKTEPLDALAAAATAVASDEVVITPALVGLAEVVERRGELPSLSTRQRQVLAGRARGETFRRIARSLGISEKVAHEYMGEVTAKFADYLRSHSPADLERRLGIGAGDLLHRPRPVER